MAAAGLAKKAKIIELVNEQFKKCIRKKVYPDNSVDSLHLPIALSATSASLGIILLMAMNNGYRKLNDLKARLLTVHLLSNKDQRRFWG